MTEKNDTVKLANCADGDMVMLTPNALEREINAHMAKAAGDLHESMFGYRPGPVVEKPTAPGTTSADLKPCPLCGHGVKAYYSSDYYEGGMFIECPSCLLKLPVDGKVLGSQAVKVDDKDIAQWNSRPRLR